MSAYEKTFQTYQLGDNPAELAEGVVRDMAAGIGYAMPDEPTEQTYRELIGYVGPNKELQQNIGTVQDRLGEDAVSRAADWVDRSGMLLPVDRSFAHPELRLPSDIETAVVTGGVARWFLRSANQLQDATSRDGLRVGRALIAAGNRTMKETEHAWVAEYASKEGALPTEADFARTYVVPSLAHAGFETELIAVNSGKGSDVARAAAEYPGALDGSVLVASNAGAAIQNAAQFRAAARAVELRPNFDITGDQLYMTSDTIEQARHGESAAIGQNPITALGMVARSALALHQQA